MKTRKSSSRLKTTLKPVLDLAKVLGELGYRQSLVNHDLKTLELRTRTESAWIKKAESAGRKADAEDFRKHSKYLVRKHFLAQEELETLEKLEAEIQSVMNEKIDRLTKRLECSL